VSNGYIPSSLMIDFGAGGLRQKIRDVLNKRSLAKHIQNLQAVTDPQHRLAQPVSILQQEIVNGIAPGISSSSMRRPLSMKLCRINVGFAARQEHCVTKFDYFSDFVRRMVEPNPNCLSSNQFYGALILGDRAFRIL
jgi:hypothetical protein